MSELIHDKVVKEILQELIGEAFIKESFAESLVNKYLQDLKAQTQLLVKSGSKEEDLMEEYLLQEFRDKVMNTVVEALIKSSEFKDSLYKKSYERLKALGDGSLYYGDLFSEIYQDEPYLNEIFVRLVEETEEVAITSAKQLQELTGLTEVCGHPDEEIEKTFTIAMSYRYSKVLEDILEAGGKYSDLLQVKPSFFKLP